MPRVKPSYYVDVEKKIKAYFYETFFAPLLEDLPVAPRLNASTNALTAAITSGRVVYKDGVFSGTFNASISRELSAFATFDGRSRTWKGRPPANILGSAIQANDKRARLTAEINKKIDALADRVDETIKTLSFSVDLPLFSMSEEISKSLGITPQLDPRTAERLKKDYNESQKLNIKNWAPEQVERLRGMVEKYQTSESNEALTDIIQREWNVSANKAAFLARQETSLFFSKFSMERAKSSGVRRYRWSTSHDERVRVSHKELNGTIHSVDDPPIVDPKTGRRAHPGCDYNCRCTAIWILE